MLKRSYKRIHFVGVGGSGVSALAHLMLQMKYEVTGSDLRPSSVTRELQDAGATIWIGHDERYVRLADLVVASTAIPENNLEVAAAKDKGIPLLTRIELLRYMSERKTSVVISGSHGKSTTTSMVANVCLAAQLDPTVVLGSVMRKVMGSARYGKSDLFICEGDESNNSILEFQPTVAAVTNIDRDHLDFHGSMSNLKDSFIRFLNSPPRNGFSVVCCDDANIRSIMGKLTGKVVTYGFHPDADYQAQGRRVNDKGGLSFEVHHRDEGPLGKVEMAYPGDHSIQNALCTVAICRGLGLGISQIAFALDTFPGVYRRYEVLHAGEVTVIDDYAHHPSEITALLSGVREIFAPSKHRIRAIFQPHRYTRSKSLAQQFPPSFGQADEIILAPIYTANEKPIAGIGLDYLNRFFTGHYDERKLKCFATFTEIEQYVTDSLKPGDVVLTIGAGDIGSIAHSLVANLDKTRAEQTASVDLERLEEGLAVDQPLFPD